MIATITIEANSQSEFIERLDQIRNAVETNSIEDNQLMDGSYQVNTANIELESV